MKLTADWVPSPLACAVATAACSSSNSSSRDEQTEREKEREKESWLMISLTADYTWYYVYAKRNGKFVRVFLSRFHVGVDYKREPCMGLYRKNGISLLASCKACVVISWCGLLATATGNNERLYSLRKHLKRWTITNTGTAVFDGSWNKPKGPLSSDRNSCRIITFWKPLS